VADHASHSEAAPWQAGARRYRTIFVGTIDNFIRPFLIKRGADLPLLLIFAGVIGGLIAFGLVGLFIGPAMLAVTYTLLEAWVMRGKAEQEELRPEESSTD